MIYVSRRLLITCLLLVSACVVAGIWGLRSGAVTLETSQVFAALMGDAPRSMTMVVTEWRLPRVLMALLIGAALGVSGAIFQSLMRNPLGSPDVMGFNTGAWSGVLVAMVLFAGVRERMESCDIPQSLKGLPITLVAASLVAVSFLGFNGLVEGLLG